MSVVGVIRLQDGLPVFWCDGAAMPLAADARDVLHLVAQTVFPCTASPATNLVQRPFVPADDGLILFFGFPVLQWPACLKEKLLHQFH